MEFSHTISRCGMFRRNLGMCSIHALVNGLPSLVFIGSIPSGERGVKTVLVICAAMLSLSLVSTAGYSILRIDMRGGSLFARALRIALKARMVMVGLILTGFGVGYLGFRPAYVAAFFLSPDLWCRWAAWIIGRSVWRAHNLHEYLPNSARTNFIAEYLISLLTFLLLLVFVLIIGLLVKCFLGRKRRRRIPQCPSV